MTPPTRIRPRYAADWLLILPSDPAAATEEILRRREESGFSTSLSAPTPLMRSLLSSPS